MENELVRLTVQQALAGEEAQGKQRGGEGGHGARFGDSGSDCGWSKGERDSTVRRGVSDLIRVRIATTAGLQRLSKGAEGKHDVSGAGEFAQDHISVGGQSVVDSI